MCAGGSGGNWAPEALMGALGMTAKRAPQSYHSGDPLPHFLSFQYFCRLLKLIPDGDVLGTYLLAGTAADAV